MDFNNKLKEVVDRMERTVRGKTIDEVVSRALERLTELETEDPYATVTECKVVLSEISEELKD